MSPPLPLADAARRLRRPAGRPRKPATPSRALADQASVPLAAPVSIRVPAPTVAGLWLDGPRLLDLKAAAAYLSVSTWTLRDYLAAGLLPLVKLPRPGGGTLKRILVDRVDLDRLIRDGKAAT